MNNQNYKSHFAKLMERRTDSVSRVIRLDERVRSAPSSETVRYVLGSMLPVDQEYTQNTYAEAERVQNQLLKGLPTDHAVDFGYQGSVTNNTHIRLYSDIDLLTATQTFWWLKAPLVPSQPWTGDTNAVLRSTRQAAIEILKSQFPEADVDATKGKAIGISGGSLRRSIDVVVCGWLHTFEYQQGNEAMRGIRVYDADNHTTIENYPFLHNRRIDEKDKETNGNAKRLMRFAKSVKADADREIDLSSWDLVGMVWNMPREMLAVGSGNELSLVDNLVTFTDVLLTNETWRKTLMVPNRTRPLFVGGASESAELKKFADEVGAIASQLRPAERAGLRLAMPKLNEIFGEASVLRG